MYVCMYIYIYIYAHKNVLSAFDEQTQTCLHTNTLIKTGKCTQKVSDVS